MTTTVAEGVDALTPRQIVEALDKYIVGQGKAKRAVAVALRNRYCCSRVREDLRDEITPKNILMIGPTGVGKTGDRLPIGGDSGGAPSGVKS